MKFSPSSVIIIFLKISILNKPSLQLCSRDESAATFGTRRLEALAKRSKSGVQRGGGGEEAKHTEEQVELQSCVCVVQKKIKILAVQKLLRVLAIY